MHRRFTSSRSMPCVVVTDHDAESERSASTMPVRFAALLPMSPSLLDVIAVSRRDESHTSRRPSTFASVFGIWKSRSYTSATRSWMEERVNAAVLSFRLQGATAFVVGDTRP